MNNTIRTIMVWLVIGVILTMVFMQVGNRTASQNSLDYSTFMEEARQGHIAKVKLDNNRTLKATGRDGKQYTVNTPGIQDPWMVGDLMKFGVQVEAQPVEEQSLLMSIFVSWFPMLLLIGVWIFFMRQMQGGGRGGAFSFGKSRARMLDENQNQVTFADVAGVDEAKE
ncbi:MAG: ATP-dependent metallopeptidase FtsH/Yme1/Tma family protein, partial [Usitatibacter sp.]